MKLPRLPKAFTLIEILFVIAVMSIVGAAGYMALGNIGREATNVKLRQDVAALNRAVKIYRIGGGSLEGIQQPLLVLSKLKKAASNAKQIASINGAKLDFRIKAVIGRGIGPEVAYWDSPAQMFKIVSQSELPSQTTPIAAFDIDPMATPSEETETRTANLKLAEKDLWVWDYKDYPSGIKSPLSILPTEKVEADPPAAAPENIPLDAPGFSIAAGNYAFWTYPKSLSLLSTNPSGAGEILYSVNSGPFVRYNGPINVLPGMNVTGISATLDPDRYDDSAAQSREYTTTPVTLQPAVTFSKPGYNYFELGGEADPGTPPPLPSGAVNGSGAITNLAQIPPVYQSSSVFRFVWTLDGSDPLTSGTAKIQPDFSEGFVPPSLPVPLAAFGTSSATSVRAAVKGVNGAYVTDSSVTSSTLNTVSLPLRPPSVSIAGLRVTITPDLSGRDTPKNTRMYYTTNGTDPGDADGEPAAGAVLYSSDFLLNPGNSNPVTVTARLYPPSQYKRWFSSSAPAAQTYTPTEGIIGGIDLAGLADKYLFFFASGSADLNWQGATKGFAGNVLVDGILAAERTSGGVPYAGTISTNDVSLGAWQSIVNQNPGQAAAGSTGNIALVTSMKTKLIAAFTQINALAVTSGYANRSSTSLDGLNTQNGISERFVIDITSGLSISSKIHITGDAGDVFILRWDTDGNLSNGYHGQVKFQSGGGIVPHGGLKAGNFIHVAGDLGASGGGSNPPAPYPQGPRLYNGTGALISGGSDFAGGGFFTGYWLTTGAPNNGETQSLSNAIFVGGWYSLSAKLSMTSGTSGVYVAPNSSN